MPVFIYPIFRKTFEAMHTTNYFNTFIRIAEDCPVSSAEVPPLKKEKSIANLQFEMIGPHPYKYTSDEVIFGIHALRNGLSNTVHERENFFAKGQACLRASPLSKRYGWGIHSNEDGKVALYPAGSEAYEAMAKDPELKQVLAMRSKRK